MVKSWGGRLVTVMFGWGVCWGCLASEWPVLRVGLADQASPPFVMGEGEQLSAPRPGLLIEQVEQAAAVCRLHVVWQRFPGMRVLRNLQSGTIDAGFLSYSPERAQFVVYPGTDGRPDASLRVASMQYALYVRSNSTLTWDGHQLSNPQAIIGSNAGWAVEQDIRQHGWQVETAAGIDSNFAKLLAGRIDAYAIQSLPGKAYLAQHPGLGVRALSPPLSSRDYFLPLGKPFVARYPQLAQCLWQHLGREREALFRARLPFYRSR